jgi:recombination protein RecR
MKIARPISRLIESFQKLPGVGPKSAQRLTFYLLHVPQVELDSFAESLSRLKKDTAMCAVCKNVTESDPCDICSDIKRDKSTVMVVEQPLDVIAFERTGRYNGIYHVLHGAISPLENIGPDEIFIDDLLRRLDEENDAKLKEVIIATNPTMEGDATAMYIAKKIHELFTNGSGLSVTRLGMGIPTGADLEYADETTLRQALEGRRTI